MLSWVTGFIGIVAALTIILLIRRDHLHVRYGLWWIVVAAAFVLLGVFPQIIDWLAARLGIAYGPVLALTLGLTVFVIKVLTIDIARSRNETRIIRLIQRIAMLEAEVNRLREQVEASPDAQAPIAAPLPPDQRHTGEAGAD
ncbi:MAG: DUF2304 domain-containing protein [Pseudomonadota bacterium]